TPRLRRSRRRSSGRARECAHLVCSKSSRACRRAGHARHCPRDRTFARFLRPIAWRLPMTELLLSPPVLGFVVVTRAALAFGLGLLMADRIPASRRRTIALTLIGIGAATTIQAVKSVFGSRAGAGGNRECGTPHAS